MSNWAIQQPDSIKEQSNWVRQQPDWIKDQPDWVRQQMAELLVANQDLKNYVDELIGIEKEKWFKYGYKKGKEEGRSEAYRDMYHFLDAKYKEVPNE